MQTQISGADIVDTSFDRYARMVARALRVPVALVTRLEPSRQVFLGAVGLSEPWATCRETPLSHSFCQYVVSRNEPLVVSDARESELLRDNLAISELDVIAYAGWPITDHTGFVIGSLCAIDAEPRDWTEAELAALEDLAAACSAELTHRGLRALAAQNERSARDLNRRSRLLLELSEGLSATQTTDDVADAVERIAVDHLGCLRAGLWLRSPEHAQVAPDPRRTTAEERGPEMLTFLEPTGVDWESATRYRELPLDESNPLGRTLLEGRAIYFGSRAAQNAGYPHLAHEKQIGEARAFIPLRIRGQMLGVLTLLWATQEEISEETQTTIRGLAAYTSQALQRALLFEDRVEALVTLQRSLMPSLPRPEHLALAARYRPAAKHDQVGGDWYDAVVMPNGATTLMIGDVVGHDIGAAATMGQLRNMLRAFAWALEDPPSRNVARLDQAMHDFGLEGMASLVYARIEADHVTTPAGARHVLRWTNAGHPPPLLVGPDGSLEWLSSEGHADLMIGVAPGGERGDHRTLIAPDSTLLLFTDGLVERRGEHIGVGLSRLAEAAVRHHDLPVEDFLDAVLEDRVGPGLEDDVAVLAVRFAAVNGERS